MGQLADKIRAKYPSVYDHLDDITLETKVADKYPQYRSMVSAPLDPAKMGQDRTIPGMGQIPDQTGRGANLVGLQPQTGVQPKAPTIRDMVNNPVSEFMSKPISSHLPQSIQDYLATRQPNTLSMERTPAGMEDMPNPTGSANLYKAAMQRVNPGQVAAGVGTVMGGAPGLVANAALGVQGGLDATDPNRSTSERVIAGLSGLAGLAGTVPGLKAFNKWRSTPSAPATKSTEALSPAAQKLQDAFETALDTKNKVTYPKHLQEDFKLGMEGKDAQFAVRSKAEADAAAQNKASGIMGHFATLDPKSAGKRTEVLGLAKGLQNLDEIAATAGEATPGLSASQVKYYEPPAKVGASSAPAKAVEEVKVPSIDEVMFKPPEVKQRPKPMDPGPPISDIRFDELMKKFGGKGPDVPPKSTIPGIDNIVNNSEIEGVKRLRDIAKRRAAEQGYGDLSAPQGVSETLNSAKPKSAAEDLAARLGTPELPTPVKGKPKLLRTEDALRNNPRVQALSKEERQQRYIQGNSDKEAAKWKPGQSDDPNFDPSKLYSGVDPGLARAAWRVPAVRMGVGGIAGYNYDEEHPYLGGLVGAGAGLVAAPGKYGGGLEGIKSIIARRYESLLSGAPQLSNIGGNIGGTIAAPALEALRGNIGGAGKLAKHILRPETIPTWIKDAIQEYKTAKEITRLGEKVKTVGPAGKVLQSVDKATKNLLHGGGLSEATAGDYTLSNLPSTRTGKLAKQVQAAIPGTQILTPFINTAIKANEMAAATSPLRFTSKALREMVPAQDYVTKGGTKIPKAVFEALLTLPAMGAGAAGLAGVHAPFEDTIGQVPASATLGPFALPYQTGRQIRNYAKYGRDNPKDVADAFLSNVPLAGDLPAKIQDPLKSIADIPAQFIPQASMMIGDKTVRETKADDNAPWYKRIADEAENSIKARLPWERTKLPAKRTFLGDEKKRNLLGQYPADDFDTDKLAKRLSDVGAPSNIIAKFFDLPSNSLLRRSPSQSLGGLSPKAKLMQMATDKQFAGRPGLQELVDALTPLGNITTTPQQESRLGELRGKSVRADLTPIVDTPRFKGLPKEVQDILLELMVSNAHTKGTKAFKTERSIEAAKNVRK